MITKMIDPFVALHQNYNPYRRFWKTIQFRNVAETRGRKCVTDMKIMIGCTILVFLKKKIDHLLDGEYCVRRDQGLTVAGD